MTKIEARWINAGYNEAAGCDSGEVGLFVVSRSSDRKVTVVRMPEAAGPANQAGIYYQNTVAADFLARMLKLQVIPEHDAVCEVRVEAPAAVDDIVVRYVDGRRDWIQAKMDLQASGGAWQSLWRDIVAQILAPSFGQDDRVVLVLGERTDLGLSLQAMCDRASTSEQDAEWARRLTEAQARTLAAVKTVIGDDVDALRLFRRLQVRIVAREVFEDQVNAVDLGAVSRPPSHFLSSLRDLVGGAARIRAIFRPAELRLALNRLGFAVTLFEPAIWGLPAYRDTISRLSRIEIPGRGESVPIQDLFVWPKATRFLSGARRDFEDEVPSWTEHKGDAFVDLATFPSSELSAVILIAGPGFGKTTLLRAVAAKLLHTPIVPVEVKCGLLALGTQSVIEYLDEAVNRHLSVRVGWSQLAEQGLVCALFDGLDEVATEARSSVMLRISTFAARFPHCPWMLSVRDPAALNGPLAGELVELQPFGNGEIYSLVEKLRPWSSGLDQADFMDALHAYPDMARLAKVPLFLSMILASWRPTSSFPQKRAGLIEAYVGKLLEAPHGQNVVAPLPVHALRRLAEAIAFDALEHQEIGLSPRRAQQIAAATLPQYGSMGVDELLRRSVIRANADSYLEFPYPIVQEYLAAVHLVDTRPAEISSRIADVVKRPWAQVIQFALELVEDASDLIRAMLGMQDDLFSTGLRLIGRCVANGARVDANLAHEIGTRLAELWGRADYRTREKVGRLLVDRWSKPLHPAVKGRLVWRWLLGGGAEDIINQENSPALTSWVLDGLLERTLDGSTNVRMISVPLQAIASDVVRKVTARAKAGPLTEDIVAGLQDFLEVIELSPEDAHLADALAEDESMPTFIRLTAFATKPGPLAEPVRDWAVRCLSSASWREQAAASAVLVKVEDKASLIERVLTSKVITEAGKFYLMSGLERLVPAADQRKALIKELRTSEGISSRFKDMMAVYVSRLGDHDAYVDLVDRLDTIEDMVAKEVLSAMNTFPEEELGLLALEKVRQRAIEDKDVPAFVSSVVTGLVFRIQAFGWASYALHDAPLHPTTKVWLPVLDEWAGRVGFSKVQRLRIQLQLLRFRSELIEPIRDTVFQIQDLDDPDWEEDEGGHVLRQALDEIRRYRLDIPTAVAERFAMSRKPNIPYAGIAAVAAPGNLEALDHLKALYLKVDEDHRSDVLNAIEMVAARCQIAVTDRSFMELPA